MFPDNDEGPAETAIAFTDQFVDAGVVKLAARFGDDYARDNPTALAAYVAACASNLNAFMTAATMMAPNSAFDEALASLEDELPLAPAPKPKKGRRR